MARGINKAIIVGNLGADPDVRYSSNNSTIANISVATTQSWKDKETGEQHKHTEWHRVVFFGRLAEVVGEYLRKGSQVYVEGRLQTRKWQDKEGVDRYTTQIVANELQMLGGRQNSEPAGSRNDASRTGQPEPGAGKSGSIPDEDFDDDIPF